MNFKDELINNLNVPNTKYVDLDYAMERLEDENKSYILKDIPNDKKITDMESYIDMNYLVDRLENDEKSQYQVMGNVTNVPDIKRINYDKY